VKPGLVNKKGKAIEMVKLERIHEGLCVQILHLRPFSDEPRSQKVLHGFIEEQRAHHEIYMSDPRRTPQEK
jgi:hypothetical protein